MRRSGNIAVKDNTSVYIQTAAVRLCHCHCKGTGSGWRDATRVVCDVEAVAGL